MLIPIHSFMTIVPRWQFSGVRRDDGRDGGAVHQPQLRVSGERATHLAPEVIPAPLILITSIRRSSHTTTTPPTLHLPNRRSPNCRSATIILHGKRRVCIFAARDIAEGEELW
jgi:hypothetical protein